MCNLNNHARAICAVRYAKDSDGNVILGQDEYIKQTRPVQHHVLTGADAEAEASNMVTDMFASLRGALVYALFTQVRFIVYVVSLQRAHEPTNMQARRLSAITGKLQAPPEKIDYQALIPAGEVDLHSDSGYWRLNGVSDDEVEGYGISGANLLRRGRTHAGKPVGHLVDAPC
eukprot:4393826-Pyramimonas_sp.AAC.1